MRSRKSESDVIRQAVNQVATSKSNASLVSEQKPTQSETDHGTVRSDSGPSEQSTTMDWPSIDRNAIDEFNSEGYWSSAFPTLFPTGDAEYLAPRHRRITLGQFLKHLILYDDGRFAQHARLCYFTVNTMMRWRALETGRVFVKQRIGDNHIRVEELKDMVNQGQSSFASRVIRIGSSLHGSKQYWLSQRRNLMAMEEALGMPSIFFTMSAADLKWSELQVLMTHFRPNNDLEKASERVKAVVQNPHLTDGLFLHRAENFLTYFFENCLDVKDYWV